jgi:hypothetical protein
MMPGSRHARWIMGILAFVVIAGLVLAAVATPA